MCQRVLSLCVCAGLQSGFVTLPRLPRVDRQVHDGDIHKGCLVDSSEATLTRSDSLTSFTVDLGPSLMSEVLSLFDSPSCFQMSDHHLTAGEEEEDDCSLTETPVQSPEVTSPNPSVDSGTFSRSMNIRGHSCSSNRTEQGEDRRSLRSPSTPTTSPQRAEPVMESERFQRAADVLSRHYGGGSFTTLSNNTASPAFSYAPKTPYIFSEEEEEIKV